MKSIFVKRKGLLSGLEQNVLRMGKEVAKLLSFRKKEGKRNVLN